ncbi:O-antigen ligase family protein [Candidatus Gottesmanbacteria bacterium]|nr:O-antigen ligase family protein [Candidatus Gottesmanbacteria bacterium]
MRKLLKWLDNNHLSLLAGFLLIFIPLYPKLPLFDVLPGYIVRVRLEDFFVSVTLILWLISLWRKKVELRGNPLAKPIALYLTIGLLSLISAVFIIRTVPFELLHIQKVILHFLRRIEYFSLFFVFYSSIKNTKTLKIYLGILIITSLAVAFYGFGQKYLYWPAFSTMNREFAKGWMLYLTQHARVLSTFGGHYDLAAFTMMVLILFWSLFFSIKHVLGKIALLGAIAAVFWTLILTASRTSFLAYIAGITMMFFFWMFRKGFFWSMKRWIFVLLLSIFVMLSFGDLSERFTKLLKIEERLGGIKLLVLSPFGKPPDNRAVFLVNNPKDQLSQITSSSDQPPTPLRPSDVNEDFPLMIPTGGTLSAVPRTYSKTAFTYDLSTAIRFDALWPMAIAGFKKNPVLGSGYSTLNKTQFNQFTEAESTDNDYLRALGETGILGFLAFFSIQAIILFYLWRNIPIMKDPVLFAGAAGLGGIVAGLLVNAIYIDVYESSKVAFMYWAIVGIIVAGIRLLQTQNKEKVGMPQVPGLADTVNTIRTKTLTMIKSDTFLLGVVLAFSLYARLYKINTPLADWHSWRQADTSAVTRNFVKYGVNLLYPTYDDLSNVASGQDNPKGYRFVEFPLYNFAAVIIDKIFVGYNIEVSGRLTSIFASLGSMVFLFALIRKYVGRVEAFLSVIIFGFLPYNIYFSRVILPEPFLVFTTLGSIYFFDRLVSTFKTLLSFENRVILKAGLLFIVSVLFCASALLVKPYALFLFLPLVYIWFKAYGYTKKSILILMLYFVIISVPFLFWRYWISHFPEGIPASMWLLNGDGIRFKGAFFYWIFADRLVRLIAGYWGLPLLLFGILARPKKEGWFLYWFGIGTLLYLIVFATGNVRHDYYQVLTIPIISIFAAKGIVFLFEIPTKLISRVLRIVILLAILVFSFMFGWYHVRDYYNINHPEIVEAGSIVERKTSTKALVIAPYGGDTAFLYQTRRAGWPIVQGSIDELIGKGADYYVSVAFDDLTKELINDATNPDLTLRHYKIIDFTPTYVLIQLVSDNKLPQ